MSHRLSVNLICAHSFAFQQVGIEAGNDGTGPSDTTPTMNVYTMAVVISVLATIYNLIYQPGNNVCVGGDAAIGYREPEMAFAVLEVLCIRSQLTFAGEVIEIPEF